MSIKNENNQERWNDPADQNEPTGIRGMEIVYAIEKKQEREVETTVDRGSIQRPIMGEVISNQLKEGMVFYTNEHKEKIAKGKGTWAKI